MSTLTDSSLTAAQLTRAASDLRNAALVTAHAGHTKHSLVDDNGGQVCALGAIELATYKKLVRDRLGWASSPAIVTGLDGALYRCDLAVKVFADFVPTALCDMCDDDKIAEHNKDCAHKCQSERESYDKVTHYNDAHCVSPELLVNLFGLAADRALDAVAERRSMLSGDRIPVLV